MDFQQFCKMLKNYDSDSNRKDFVKAQHSMISLSTHNIQFILATFNSDSYKKDIVKLFLRDVNVPIDDLHIILQTFVSDSYKKDVIQICRCNANGKDVLKYILPCFESDSYRKDTIHIFSHSFGSENLFDVLNTFDGFSYKKDAFDKICTNNISESDCNVFLSSCSSDENRIKAWRFLVIERHARFELDKLKEFLDSFGEQYRSRAYSVYKSVEPGINLDGFVVQDEEEEDEHFVKMQFVDLHRHLDKMFRQFVDADKYPETVYYDVVRERLVDSEHMPLFDHSYTMISINGTNPHKEIETIAKANYVKMQRNKPLIPKNWVDTELADDADDEHQCIICMTNKKCIALIPCGHYNMCVSCTRKMNKVCPTCKGTFTKVTKIFE